MGEILAVSVPMTLGAISISTIIMNGWVKAAHIKELKEELRELRAKTDRIEVFDTKITQVEKTLIEIKEYMHELRGK